MKFDIRAAALAAGSITALVYTLCTACMQISTPKELDIRPATEATAAMAIGAATAIGAVTVTRHAVVSASTSEQVVSGIAALAATVVSDSEALSPVRNPWSNPPAWNQRSLDFKAGFKILLFESTLQVGV